MAKGNIFMGYGRGKVGSVVYSINRGQQVSRAYNPTKNNPRTYMQTARRIRWTVASLFYKHAQQAQFKFAYENRKGLESEQNVFMKLNRDNGMFILKDQVGEDNLPMLGNWIISKGTLKKLPYGFDSSGHVQIDITVPNVDIQTVTNMSQLREILLDYGYKINDIITITTIESEAIAGESTVPIDYDDTEDRPIIQWKNIQFVLTSNLYGSLSSLGLSVTRQASKRYIIRTTSNVDMETINGCVVQVSRHSPRKLMVTTSRVQMNGEAQQAYEYATSAEWIRECMNDWGMGEPATLKGYEASTTGDGKPLSLEIDFDIPAEITDLSNKHVIFNKIISRADVAKRLAIWFEDVGLAQYRLSSTSQMQIEVFAGNYIDLAFYLMQDAANPFRWTITNPTQGGFTLQRLALLAQS